MIGWGIALSTGGVAVFLGRKLITSENRKSAEVGLYVATSLSLGGSLFLVGYAVQSPDFRLLGLSIAAGLLFAGIFFLMSARRLHGPR